MQPESLKLLTDMRNAASDIAAFVDGESLQGFLGNK